MSVRKLDGYQLRSKTRASRDHITPDDSSMGDVSEDNEKDSSANAGSGENNAENIQAQKQDLLATKDRLLAKKHKKMNLN